MKVGSPKETKIHEYRVGLTPESAAELVAHGHEVLIESGAGEGIDASDADYAAAGSIVCSSAAEVFDRSDMIVKVKEPLSAERKMLRKDQLLFTYLHLAADAEQASDLIASGATCIAYETVTDAAGTLPLLKPMSQVAGRLSVQAGATALEKSHGGRGILLGGVPGVAPANVLIIGGGVVGLNAALMAVGLGADVTILDKSADVLEKLSLIFGGRAKTLFANNSNLAKSVAAADLVVGAVLVPGAAAPRLIDRKMLGTMKSGSVLVDVAIDQGGCFETSRPTTHDNPTFIVDDVVHYCVANMPGAVARTSTYALNSVTLPHTLRLADKGWRDALRSDPHLAAGLNVHAGNLTCRPVAEALSKPYVSTGTLTGLAD